MCDGFFSCVYAQEKGYFMCVMDFSRVSMPKKKDLLCDGFFSCVYCPRIRTFYVCDGFFSCVCAQEKGHFMCVMDFSRVSMPKN